MGTEAVILAGGIGKRLAQAVPKPLLDLCGKPLLGHVMETATAVADKIHVVHGPPLAELLAGLEETSSIPFASHLQPEPRGTADALGCALPAIEDSATVIVLCADVPLLQPDTLAQLLSARPQTGVALLTMRQSDNQLGRIVRGNDGQVLAIREHADATEDERHIDECNTGVMAASAGQFREWCARITDSNAQGEFYLTDCIAEAMQDGIPIETRECNPIEGLGVNTMQEFAVVAEHWQKQARERLMAQGALMEAPDTVWLSAGVALEEGAVVRVGPHVVFRESVQLADGADIGPYTLLRNCKIGADTKIEPFTVIEAAQVGARCRIGPYARIRPETELAEGVQIGNFVEVKKSRIGEGTKVNHLSYVGDSEVGRSVNLGAGTITCNYDGAHKHTTVIGDDVFVGSGTQLIAPVSIGAGATIGAGSTITRDTPPGELTLSRSEQKTHQGWKRPRKD